tara:strand:- start:182 stop:334 length:153 start_codon:yes stop_codon:yes gene_type:complete
MTTIAAHIDYPTTIDFSAEIPDNLSIIYCKVRTSDAPIEVFTIGRCGKKA